MRVQRDERAGTCTLVPTTPEERAALDRVASLGTGATIPYVGREGEDWRDPRFSISFSIGEHRLRVHGDDEESRRVTGGIRDTCFCATSGLTYLGTTEDGIGFRFTGGYCARCGSPIITRAACEWRVCDACAERCAHEYRRGIVHGGGIDIGVDEYCGSCGRAKPRPADQSDFTPAMHALLAEAFLRERDIVAVVLPRQH